MQSTIRPPARRSRRAAAAGCAAIGLVLCVCTPANAEPPSGKLTSDAITRTIITPGANALNGADAALGYIPLPDGSTIATAERAAQNVPKPEMPAVVWSDEMAGAEAAALHYYAAYRYLTLTGDSGPYLEIAPDCEDCTSLAKEYERLYRAGGWAEGGDHEVTVVDREDRFGYLSTQVEVHAVRDAHTLWFRPDPDDPPDVQQELQDAGTAMAGEGPLWHVDRHERLHVYQGPVADHWVVGGLPSWVTTGHPEALEGFNIRDRG